MTPTNRCISPIMLLSLACLFVPHSEAQAENPSQQLAAHSEEFRQEVIRVADGVHVAVGFGLANSILIEGTDGVIVVDTMEGAGAARAVKAEFDKITTKPVKAIIYTHNHYDHIMGAKIFAGDDQPEIYAHRTTMAYVERARSLFRGAMLPRNFRQFGIALSEEDRLNAGIGPRLVLNGAVAGSQFLAPTKTVGNGRTELEIAGVRLDLVHAPGETNDQLYVWLPEKKVLLPGDNYYKAFPNLYAIRGTPYRDPSDWVVSLEKMLAEEPHYLVPSHTRPIIGRDRVREVLTDYHDAIEFVLEETIAGMNRGLTADELVLAVRLPARLAKKPYLQEFYGTVAWSVRAIYSGNLGWFDGNPTSLFPLSPHDRAGRMAELAGGEAALLDAARKALDSGDFQWAAELADHVMLLDPDGADARRLKADALLALGVRQKSANARNYYITSARELEAAARRAAP